MLESTASIEIVTRPAPSDAPYESERGVVARDGAVAGQLVLVAQPYAAVLLEDLLRTHCSETFQFLGPDAVRGACGSFVNRAAEDKAMQRGFKNYAARCERRLPTTSVRLALACLARRELELEGKIARERYEDTFDDENACGYEALLALHEGPSTRASTDGADTSALRKRRDASATSMVVAALMCDAMRPGIEPDEIEAKLATLKEEQDVDPQSALQLLSIFEANAFSMATEDGQRLGLGIYPSASLFNHSSTPNVDVVFVGKTLVMKALRDIEAGEELTISYGEQYMPREWTRRRMLDGYGFDEYAKYANVARADAARDRASALANRSTLAFDHGTLVDLGEDCALYADEQYLADEDLARDSFWYDLSHSKLTTNSGEAGIMLVPGDARNENYHPNDDQIIIWGRFPEGVDRELTALNFSKACRIVETVRQNVEKNRFRNMSENVSMLSRATTMLAGDGDKIAGVCATHEVRKYLHLTQVVLSVSMRGEVQDVNYAADTVCLTSSNVLLRVYELCPGFSRIDAVYAHLRYQMFKVTLNLLGFELQNNDAKNAVKRIKDAILAYNDLKHIMAVGAVSGGQIYEEWSSHCADYAEDLTNLRVMAKNMIAAGAHKKP